MPVPQYSFYNSAPPTALLEPRYLAENNGPGWNWFWISPTGTKIAYAPAPGTAQSHIASPTAAQSTGSRKRHRADTPVVVKEEYEEKADEEIYGNTFEGIPTRDGFMPPFRDLSSATPLHHRMGGSFPRVNTQVPYTQPTPNNFVPVAPYDAPDGYHHPQTAGTDEQVHHPPFHGNDVGMQVGALQHGSNYQQHLNYAQDPTYGSNARGAYAGNFINSFNQVEQRATHNNVALTQNYMGPVVINHYHANPGDGQGYTDPNQGYMPGRPNQQYHNGYGYQQ